MTEREIAVQVWLLQNELIPSGYFLLKIIYSKQHNGEWFRNNRKPETARLFDMTPQEELFARFFQAEKQLVKDMDDVSLRAHREELAAIAFEARAKLTATDSEEKERRNKRSANKLFNAPIDSDDVTSDAINKVAERRKNMSKTEKLIENMMKLPGMDRATAEKLVSAGTIKNTLDTKFGKSEKDSITENMPIENKPITNPFLSSKPTESPVIVNIQEETNTVIVTETVEVEKPKIFNPFAK